MKNVKRRITWSGSFSEDHADLEGRVDLMRTRLEKGKPVRSLL